MNNQPYYGETVTIYQPALRWKVARVIGMLSQLLPLTGVGLSFAMLRHIGVLVVFLVLLAAMLMRWSELWRNRGRPYLIVSSSGLEFYGYQYVIRTSWDNLKRVTPNHEIQLHKRSVVEMKGIVLRDKNLDWERRIPLEMFHSGNDSQLFRQLRSRVPQVCP
ncbi:MAG: hypothetical protein OHK0022_35730 [Roseiflexaceae bacterium]